MSSKAQSQRSPIKTTSNRSPTKSASPAEPRSGTISPKVDGQKSDEQSDVQGVVYITQKDRYVGDIEPTTKLRHGQGCYTYSNPHFQFQGTWVNGIKDQQGSLVMRGAGNYTGQFSNGEINGQGSRTYDDGTMYIGEFLMGEKNGYGEIIYGQRNWKEHSYKGEWKMNVRSGFGNLALRNGNVYSGNFVNNQPDGDVTISYPDGSVYKGEVNRGVVQGFGEMKSTDGFTYKGVFADGKRQGAGKLSITDGTYSFDGLFANDDPQNFANEVQFELISPQLEVKQAAVDPKAKGGKGPAETKDAIFTEEEETTYGHRKIYLEYKPDAEEQQEVAFNIKILFQGPEYEDPNPPKEEEVAKKPPAKGKQAAEIVASTPQIRMIKPDPVLMQNESGRTFQFEIGRNIQIKVLKDTIDAVASVDSQSQLPTTSEPQFEMVNKWQRYYFDQQHSGDIRLTAPSKEESKDVLSQGEDQPKPTEPVWTEPSEDMLYFANSEEGVCSVKGIRFNITKRFTAGAYTIVCRDVTKGLPSRMQMKPVKVLLKIADLTEPEQPVEDKAGKQPAGKKPPSKK